MCVERLRFITHSVSPARCIASLDYGAKLALFLVPYRPLGPKNNEKNENVIARKRQPKEQPKEGSRLEHSCVTGRARSREPWTHRVVGSPADGTRVGAARNATNMIRRWIALLTLIACGSAQMQKSREVRSHEEYHKKRQDQLNRKAQSRKNALKKGGTQSKTLHELRMKKQHKNRAKKKQKRRPGL